MADPLVLVRGVHFAATLLASGTVAFAALVAEPEAVRATLDLAALRRRLSAMVWLALAVAVLSGAAWLVLLAADIMGASLAEICLHGGAWPVLTDTRFGMIWCARLALALILSLLMLKPAARKFQLFVAAIFVALLAFTGHAGASTGLAGFFHLVSDMLHLLAAGAWLGGLPAFVLVVWLAYRAAEPPWYDFAVRVTQRFSILGAISVCALLASGFVNSWVLLGGIRNLVATDYGRLLALKIGLFAAMVSIAAVNRFYLTGRLPQRGALLALQRNSLGETALGLCVLLVVGLLGTMPPSAHVHAAPTLIPPDAAFVHIHLNEAMADVTINPGRVGVADVTIRVSREDFSAFPAKAVRLALDPQAGGARVSEQNAVEQTDGTWVINGIEIAAPGIWTARVTVKPGDGEPIVLDAPVVISR